MNSSAEESLMALLEAMLTLAAGEPQRQAKPNVKPGGYPEEQFLDLKEEEKEEFSCNICYQILKETMQCVNSHKFCHSCLVVWSTTGQYANRVRCPVCRTHGYYFRNEEFDDQITAKKVKCHLESCTWTGLAKFISSHRHTTYGDENVSESETKSSETSIPRLTQAAPRAPPPATSRFAGTGLTTRNDSLTPSQTTTPRGPLLAGRASSRVSPSSLSTTSQETVTEIPRRSTGIVALRSNANGTAPRRIPPVRSNNNNRIIFNHTGPNTDANNNIGGSQAFSTAANIESEISNDENSQGIPNSIAGGLTPRPPSAPRTSSNTVNVRRLPRIVNPNRPQVQGSRFQPTSEAQQRGNSLEEIRDRLQESRSRLNNLMSSFSGELDRNRQEMMQFQQERERHRRGQLEEVRELGQRLGQVAFELRRLLEHRRRVPDFDDSDDDDDI